MLWDGGQRLSVHRQFIYGIIIISAYPVSSPLSTTISTRRPRGIHSCRWFSDVLNISRQAVDLTDVYNLPNIMYTVTLVTKLVCWPWKQRWYCEAPAARCCSSSGCYLCNAHVAWPLLALLTPWRTLGAVSRERWSCHHQHPQVGFSWRWRCKDPTNVRVGRGIT